MSAHWESKALEVSSSTRPETWHDFRGFPPELYEIRYSAPGQPELAEEILKLLADAHFVAHANSTRPRDHGVWMPLYICIQKQTFLSLKFLYLWA